jgi:hypothetical protein
MDSQQKILAGIAEKIRKLRTNLRAKVIVCAANVRAIGRELLKVRTMLPKGLWGKWLMAELEMMPDAAYRYIRIAENWEKVESHPDFGSLPLMQMFDVARDLPPKKRVNSVSNCTLNSLFNNFEARIIQQAKMYPKDLARFVTQLAYWRGVLQELELLSRPDTKIKFRGKAIEAGYLSDELEAENDAIIAERKREIRRRKGELVA